MSCASLVIFKDGKADHTIEFQNAWGGSARIWDALFKAHVPKKQEYDSWIANPDDRRLWDLALREDLPTFERAVHAFTFDLFYVRQEHFGKLSNDLRLFVEKHPAGKRVDHLLAWAERLDSNPSVEAIGLHGTSVSENPWYRPKVCSHCGNSTDESEPVPLAEGTEVYDWLEKQKDQSHD